MNVSEYIKRHSVGNFYWKDCRGYYLGCNLTFAKIAGLKSADEIVGKSDRDLFLSSLGEEGIQKLIDVDRKVIDNNMEITTEELGVNEHGQPAYYISKKVPLKENNNQVIGIFGISLDISDKKEKERLQIQNTIVEHRAKTAAMMAASIAHELRTPLATIDSIMDNMSSSLPILTEGYQIAQSHNLLNTKLKKSQIDLIENCIGLLKQVVKAANTFVDMMLMKVSLDNVKPQKLEKLSIKACVQDALGLYPLTETEKQLIKCELPIDFEFKGDATLFRHIIFNMLKNALYYVKAADKGSIELFTDRNEKYNILHFKDTGKGISAKILPHIFDQFFTKTRHGTGVGLALCKIIINEFGGDISCDSIEGEYTDFILQFPKIEHS